MSLLRRRLGVRNSYMAQSAYYPDVLVEYLNLFHGCEGTKKSHSIQMKWEYILVNKNENAINTGLDFGGLNFQTSGLDFVSR